jgi:membrane protease YdiL (CAAX protease family)
MLSYLFLSIILASVTMDVVLGKKEHVRFMKADSQGRLKFYRNGFKMSWISGAIGLIGLIATETLGNLWAVKSWAGVGDGVLTTLISVLAYVAIGGICLFILYQMQATRKKMSAKDREQIRKASSAGNVAVLAMIPHNKPERKWGALLAIAAGFNEEMMYRALLLSVLVGILGEANVVLAAIIAVVLFGLSHSYQGVSGVVSTALMGMVLMAVYLCVGNIFVPMLLHFLIDFNAITVNSLVFERAGLFRGGKTSLGKSRFGN